MEIKNLREVFLAERKLDIGLEVSSKSDDDLIVYGYIQTCRKFNMVVNDEERLICSDRIYQKRLKMTYDKTIKEETAVAPIYSYIEMAKEDIVLPLEDLYIQKFMDDSAYLTIISRDAKRISKLKSYEMYWLQSKHVFTEDNQKFYYKTQDDDILCKDMDGCIKGICQRVLAVCRYTNKKLGGTGFDLYRLNELYVKMD